MKNEEYLNNLRHSTAHLLAAAVMEIWPKTKQTIGPAIENGFYYDFQFEHPISEKDLVRIDQKMRELVKSWNGFEHKGVSVSDAKKEFAGNPFKLELIDEISKKGEKLTFYTSGKYTDLCRGGHIDNAKKELQHFKLLSVAGAYWRGSEKNPMLTRIYGTAWPTKEELDNYLKMLEEAKRRDHKKLGPELDLFVFSDLVGAGLPLWTPKGTLLRNQLDDFVWELRQKNGYQKVEIPHITKRELYQTSGHWDKFKDELFRIITREKHELAMKPMNCPHHTQIYARKLWSYRDLPQRYCNTTMCYRDEQTGELSGLSRLRSFTQDDAHVFCRMSQAKQEFLKVWDIVNEFYGAFGFVMRVRLSLHDPKHPEKYLGEEKQWKKAESMLAEIVKSKNADWFEGLGEAAFYGPKLDFLAKDSIGREWQVATIQLDMNMPERFDLVCINEDGNRERIVMIHAAIMGSIERFLSVLIEHVGGAFPLWLSPVQVAVLPISDKQVKYAQKIVDKLRELGLRVDFYNKPESIGKKIREAEMQKIPYMLIIGEKEQKAKTVAVRARNQKDLGAMKLDKFTDRISKEIKNKKV